MWEQNILREVWCQEEDLVAPQLTDFAKMKSNQWWPQIELTIGKIQICVMINHRL
jgi:hypothetical protein